MKTRRLPSLSLLVLAALFLQSSAVAQIIQKAEQPPPCEVASQYVPIWAHAPLLVLATNEPYPPQSAEWFVAHASLNWNESRIPNIPFVAGLLAFFDNGQDELFAKGKIPAGELANPRYQDSRPATLADDGFFLDLDVPGSMLTRGFSPRTEEYRYPPVYYEYEPCQSVTYWFFYPKSATEGVVHEGDWERLELKLDQETNRPTAVKYHQHNHSLQIPWSALPTDPLFDNHPIVFVGTGSHASYPEPGAVGLLFSSCLASFFCDTTANLTTDTAIDITSDLSWRTSLRLIDATETFWYGFGGAWGTVGNIEFQTGPTGPGSADKTR
jgi:hypothetical protein